MSADPKNTAFTWRWAVAAFALALAACGTPLHLNSDANGSTAGGVDANRLVDPNVIINPNTAGDANGVVPGLALLKCHTSAVSGTGAELSNCTCSSSGQNCPVYQASNGNSAAGPWACTSVPVSGGYVYSCQCGTTSSPNDIAAQGCGTFFNPSDPSAQPSTNTPQTTCQTVATSFGYQTTCSCTDTGSAPCDFFQGNSYTNSTTTFVEVCSSTLTATGATTVCTCNQLLQASGATCPATFVPASSLVTDLIY